MDNSRGYWLPQRHIHTCIIGPYNPGQSGSQPSFSHHSCCVCEFYTWELQFKVHSERQIFEKILAILFTLRVFVRNLLRDRILLTYIHNWSLQSFSQDCGLSSDSTHVVCVNFIHEWRTCSLTSTPNDRFLRKFFIAGVCPKSAEKKLPKIYFFSYFVLMPDLGCESGLHV